MIFPSLLILTILFVSFIYQSCLIFSSFLFVDIPFFPHPHHIIRFFYLAILPYFFLISTRSYSLLSSSSPYYSFLLFSNLALFFPHFYSFIFSSLSSSSPYYSFLLFTNLALPFPHFYSLIFPSLPHPHHIYSFLLFSNVALLFLHFYFVHIPFFPHPHHIIRFFYLAILPYFFLISIRWYSLLSSSSPYYSFLLFSNLALFFPHVYSLIFPSFLILTILFVSFI